MPSSQEFFDTYADIYDELVGSPPDTSEVVELFAAAPGTTILEFGSGTGRLAVPLARQGLEITVIELSARMIEVMRRKAGAEKIQVHHGDFTSHTLNQLFDAVIMSRNTLCGISEQELQLAAVRNAADHLSVGGRLYVDLGFRPESSSNLQLDGTVNDRVVLLQRHHDPVTQRIALNRVFIGGGAASVVRTTARYIWPSELDMMAKLAGLNLVDRWSDWRGTPPHPSAGAFVSVYKKN